jgi:hypothetical protein
MIPISLPPIQCAFHQRHKLVLGIVKNDDVSPMFCKMLKNIEKTFTEGLKIIYRLGAQFRLDRGIR